MDSWQRKKIHHGEYSEWTCQLDTRLTRSNALDAFTGDLISDAIEADDATYMLAGLPFDSPIAPCPVPNVAGSRESKAPGLQLEVTELSATLLAPAHNWQRRACVYLSTRLLDNSPAATASRIAGGTRF